MEYIFYLHSQGKISSIPCNCKEPVWFKKKKRAVFFFFRRTQLDARNYFLTTLQVEQHVPRRKSYKGVKSFPLCIFSKEVKCLKRIKKAQLKTCTWLASRQKSQKNVFLSILKGIYDVSFSYFSFNSLYVSC